jgi:hypothetical protein
VHPMHRRYRHCSTLTIDRSGSGTARSVSRSTKSFQLACRRTHGAGYRVVSRSARRQVSDEARPLIGRETSAGAGAYRPGVPGRVVAPPAGSDPAARGLRSLSRGKYPSVRGRLGRCVSGQVSVPAGITDAVAAGHTHSLTLHRDGRVTAWGYKRFRSGKCAGWDHPRHNRRRRPQSQPGDHRPFSDCSARNMERVRLPRRVALDGDQLVFAAGATIYAGTLGLNFNL